MNRLIRFLATGFYSGSFSRCPGTIGSLAALLITWFIKPNTLEIVITTLLGIWICTKGEEILQEHDSPHIVFDEFCGILFSTWYLQSIPQFIVAFILFRFFDILKPYPISKLQELPSGLGVMADDLAAGLVSRIIIALVMYSGLLKTVI
jgi:phosphatidylglycerophosphatase A